MKLAYLLCFLAYALMPTHAAAATDSAFTSAQREQTLAALNRDIGRYTFPQMIAPLRSILERHHKEYLTIDDPERFASTISRDLFAVAHDKHLEVQYSSTVLPVDSRSKEILYGSAEDTYNNFGVAGALRIRGNIGYLRLIGFSALPQSKRAFDAAMEVLRNTDAMLVDLRSNPGGNPETVDYLMRYFFSSTFEKSAKSHLVISARDTPGFRYLNKPVYVLIDDQTVSGAEAFAYGMQALRRVTVVGATSAGAANPGNYFRLNDHFSVFIPLAHFVNPITNKNWEGVGVAPDVHTDSLAALLKAYELALASAALPFAAGAHSRDAARQHPADALKAAFPY